MQSEVRLGPPSGIKTMTYLCDSTIYFICVIFAIVYWDSYDLEQKILQQFLAYIVIHGIIQILETAYIFGRLVNYKRIFPNQLERTRWLQRITPAKTIVMLNIVSYAVRLSFIQFGWYPPPTFNPAQLELYRVIFVLSIYTYMSIFITSFIILFVFITITFGRIRPGSQPYIRRMIPMDIITNSHLSPDEECPICLVENPNSTWVQLECRHKFHQQCIGQYITTSTTEPSCPLCRRPMVERAEV